ncbi:MAG TPA: hypothetical protein VF242_03945 [Nitrososphaeraceae archaeon]
MKKRIINRNLIIAVSIVSSILFFMFWFESSDAIKNDNDLQGEDFDYIFDPGEYIGEEGNVKPEKNTNTDNLNNKGNLVQHQPNEPQEKSSDNNDTNMIKKTNNEITNTHGGNTYAEDDNLNLENKVLVKARISLVNLEKRGFLSIAAFINGQEVLKNITLDKLDESKQSLNVNLPVNKETNFLKAGDRDEFFVCAYHVKDLLKEYKSLTYFDCDEGDLIAPDKPTIARLFSPSSLVYKESQDIFNNSSSKYSQLLSTNNGANSNTKLEKEKEEKDTVKVKVYSPLEDRKNTQKLKIIAMVKGQIKSVVIDNVQEEFNKIGGYTISRTFTFDRDTNIGKIQIGDKFFACVSSTDLNPPEGQECEKRVIKNIERPNVLYAR